MSATVFEPDPAKRYSFAHEIWPGAGEVTMTWKDWWDVMHRLEQALALRLRVYPGPAGE